MNEPIAQARMARLRRFLHRYWVVAVAVAVVTVLHYNTAIHWHAAHGIYRRLYYFPIILAAFRGGVRGGVGAAVLVCALYIPHAFGLIGFDPAGTVEKTLEMVLYLAVGLLTGTLTARIAAAGERQARTAGELRLALDEKTAMEAQLVRTARLAAVGRLSAGLAHEIRNPLASIRASAEILADDYAADHPKARMLGILKDETGRLNDVLTRFLAFARSEPGEAHPFDLATEARAVADLVAARPGQPPVALTSGARPDADRPGQPRAGAPGPAEPGLNAGDAAGPRGRVPSAWTAPATVDVRCRVCDDGPGFTAEAVANFGTPFFSTREGGTGLGLATSLRIVEDQGGTLRVDPEHTPGACVEMILPAAPSEPGGTP